MGSDVSSPKFRGLLVPDPRLTTVWSAQSSFSQADPQPGVPEAQGSHQLVLTSSGTQTASKTVNLQTSGAGFIGSGSNASFLWKESTDGSAKYRGYNVPNTISSFDPVSWSTYDRKDPHAIVLDDQTTIITYYRYTGSAYQVVTQARVVPSTSFATAVVVHTQSSAPSAALNVSFNPCLVKMPDQSVMLYFMTENSSLGQVVAYRSTDSGSSWTQVSSGVLPEPIDISGSDGWELEGLRAAYGGGQICLILSVESLGSASGSYIQYASDSGGITFSLIEGPELTGAIDGYGESIDLVYANDAFVVFHALASSAATAYIRFQRIGSAFTKLSLADITTTSYAAGTGKTFSYGGESDGPACCVSDDGTIYAYWALSRLTTSGSVYMKLGVVVRSTDGGVTVEDFGQMDLLSSNGPLGIWCHLGGSDGVGWNILEPCAIMCNGQVEIFTRFTGALASLTDYKASIVGLKLGGPSTVSLLPVSGYGPQLNSRGAFTETWMAVKSPAEANDLYAETQSGTGAAVLNSSAELHLTSSAAGRIYYTLSNPASDLAEGFILNFALKVTFPTISSAQSVAVNMRLANGVWGDWRVSLRFKAAAIVVYDEIASTTVATISLDMTTEQEFLVAFIGGTASLPGPVAANNGKIHVWHRTSSANPDKDWTLGAQHVTLNYKAVGPSGTNLLEWGNNLDGTTIVTNSDWKFFNVMRSSQCGGNINGQTNPDDLFGRPYASRGFRSYVDTGVFITAHDGPAVNGDQYNISTRYGYRIENIFPPQSASPRATWRSTNLAEQTIALALDQTLLDGEESLPGSDVIGICLLNVNFKTATLQGYDRDTTSWVTVCSIDTSSGMSSLNFEKKGNGVRPGTSSATQIFLHANELEGCTFALDDTSDVQYRRIVTNTSGKWDRTTTTKYPQILLEGVTGADNTSGTAGYIMAKNLTVIAKLNGARYAGYRLKIPAQTTCPDTFFQVGNIIIGWVEAFGNQYSWGRIIQTNPNTSVTVQADSSTTSKNLGPSVRQVQFAWTDGVDVSSVEGASPDPDYIKGSADGSAEALAAVGDVPFVLEGLVDMLDGPDKPVVYLPAVDKSGNTITLNRRHSFVAGRVASPARLESVVGNELSDPGEVFRVASVIIDEIV